MERNRGRDMAHFRSKMMSFVAHLLLARYLCFGFLSSFLLGLAFSLSAIGSLLFILELFWSHSGAPWLIGL